MNDSLACHAETSRARQAEKRARITLQPQQTRLLSYGSDDEEEEGQVIGPVRPPVQDSGTDGTSHTAGTASDQVKREVVRGSTVEDEPIEDESAEMDMSDDEAVPEQTKEPDRKQGTQWNDGYTGQRPALGWVLPEHEEGDAAEEYDSEDEAAMAYLKAVQTERRQMPQVLAAPSIETEPDYNVGGHPIVDFMNDEAYIGHVTPSSILPGSPPAVVDPQEAYTIKLVERFYTQRLRLHSLPKSGYMPVLNDQHLVSFPRYNNKAHADWHRCLKHQIPLPTQLYAMEQETVYSVLELLEEYLLVRNRDISTTTSAWIWGLLARLEDVGTMNNDQVWVLRGLGKKAILVQLSLEHPDAAEQLERHSKGEEAVEEALTVKGVSDGAAAIDDATMQEAGSGSSPAPTPTGLEGLGTEDTQSKRQNTFAILDTIIVIVGEAFGQRDLLEFRRKWPTS